MAQTCAVLGLEGRIVQVEVDISPGLPAFNVVGLADTAGLHRERWYRILPVRGEANLRGAPGTAHSGVPLHFHSRLEEVHLLVPSSVGVPGGVWGVYC